MKLHILKEKIDNIYKILKKDKKEKNTEVVIKVNDLVFGEPVVSLDNITVGFDYNQGKVMMSSNDKIYNNPKTESTYHEGITQVCLSDCGDKKCKCKVKSYDITKIYGIFVNDKLRFPLYKGENYGEVGLKMVVSEFNKMVELMNDELNYDKYLDFQVMKNENIYRGGLNNDTIIELRLLPLEELPNQIINL